MNRALIVVDVQHAFVNGETAHVIERIERMIPLYSRVVATRFVNPPGSPWRRFMDWTSCGAEDEGSQLVIADGRVIAVDTTGYSSYTMGVRTFLHGELGSPLGVDICGLETDQYVLASAADYFGAGYDARVIADACASTKGPEHHNWGLRLIARFIGDDRLILTSDVVDEAASAPPTGEADAVSEGLEHV